MLDADNTKVLSYMRKGTDGKSVVVALNFTGSPQTVNLDVPRTSTLMTDVNELKTASTGTITLAPYGSWVGQVR